MLSVYKVGNYGISINYNILLSTKEVCLRIPPLLHIRPFPLHSIAHLSSLPHSQVVQATSCKVKQIDSLILE